MQKDTEKRKNYAKSRLGLMEQYAKSKLLKIIEKKTIKNETITDTLLIHCELINTELVDCRTIYCTQAHGICIPNKHHIYEFTSSPLEECYKTKFDGWYGQTLFKGKSREKVKIISFKNSTVMNCIFEWNIYINQENSEFINCRRISKNGRSLIPFSQQP